MVRQRDTASAPCWHRGLLLDTWPSLPPPSVEKGHSDCEILWDGAVASFCPSLLLFGGVRHVLHPQMGSRDPEDAEPIPEGAEPIPPQVRGK